MEFAHATHVALRFEPAMNGVSIQHTTKSSRKPTPIEIRNIEGRQRAPRRTFTERQREDLRQSACFKCHMVGFRHCKHQTDASISNNAVKEGATIDLCCSSEED